VPVCSHKKSIQILNRQEKRETREGLGREKERKILIQITLPLGGEPPGIGKKTFTKTKKKLLGGGFYGVQGL